MQVPDDQRSAEYNTLREAVHAELAAQCMPGGALYGNIAILRETPGFPQQVAADKALKAGIVKMCSHIGRTSVLAQMSLQRHLWKMHFEVSAQACCEQQSFACVHACMHA